MEISRGVKAIVYRIKCFGDLKLFQIQKASFYPSLLKLSILTGKVPDIDRIVRRFNLKERANT